MRCRSSRGMVTAELAVAVLGALSLSVLLSWGIFLFVVQLRCIDAAAAIARQEARQDRSGVERARASAPDGAVIRVKRSKSDVAVTVAVRARPFARGLAPVQLRAEAAVLREPGVDR